MPENLTDFQKLLEDAYNEYRTTSRDRHPSDNKFAKWLGVSPATLNTWINGLRVPDMANTIQISKKLGPQVFRVLGTPVVHVTDDAKLDFLIEMWPNLTNEAVSDIEAIIIEDDKRRSKKNAPT